MQSAALPLGGPLIAATLMAIFSPFVDMAIPVPVMNRSSNGASW
jgi:hypothetical protein